MDGEHRMSNSSFTELLSYEHSNVVRSVLLYSLSDHIKDYYGQKAQDGHLDFHTAPGL